MQHYYESLERTMHEPTRGYLGLDGDFGGLGIDEQAPAGLFTRIVSPSDLDRARASMIEIIRGYHAGADLLNIALWRKLGWEGGPVNAFLANYMLMARTDRQAPTAQTLPLWKGRYLTRFPGSISEDVEDYFNALMDARKSGLVSDSIFIPWTYTPTSAAEDLAAAVAVPAKAAFDKLLITAAIVGTIYLVSRSLFRKVF